MRARRNTYAALLLVGLALAACGPSTTQVTAIRPDYTSEGAAKAFGSRASIAKELEPGPPVVVKETGVSYAALSQAAAEAPDGATLVLGKGLYRDSFQVAGKSLRIAGQGLGQTFVLSQESVGFVSRGRLELLGITMVSLSLKQDVAVMGVADGALNMQECRILGGTGPGLLVAGDSQVYLLANTLLGNMAGGIRLQGGHLDMRRNVLVKNALAGIVLAPSRPGAIKRITLWHDIVLDNWAGYRCQSFAKSGIVPLSGDEVVRVEASILNSGGLAEAFPETVSGRIKVEGYNFVSTPPLPVADFFANYEAQDFRPRAPLKTDELGVELGAWPSDEGLERAKSLLNISFTQGKLREALLLASFLDYTQRETVALRIQEQVSAWTTEFLQTGRLGTRLVSVLNLSQVAPAHWKMDVILQRFMEGFVQRYTFVLRPLSFFEENPPVSQAAFEFLGQHLAAFPKFLTLVGESQNAYVLSGRITIPIKSKKAVVPFRLEEKKENPHYPKIIDTIKQVQSRKVENEKKRRELEDTINSPHFRQKVGENSKHMANMRKQLAKLEEELAGADETLASLAVALERSPETFHITVQGKEHRTQVSGEFAAQLVAAPMGDIILDTTRPLDLVDSNIEAQPLPQFSYQGQTATSEQLNEARMLGQEIGRLLLETLISQEAANLKKLLFRFDEGIITSEEEDKLIELLLLSAVLIRDSVQASAEYNALAGPDSRTDVRLAVTFDESAGSGPESLRLAVKGGDADGVVAKARYLKSVYEPYWQLQKAIDRFLSVRFGLTRDDLLKLRARMDKFGAAASTELQ